MKYARAIEVPTPPGETFAYLADFTHAAEWDPGVVEARRLTPAPTAVGSRFEVIALFRGNRQRFEYVVTELEEGNRIALHGEGERAMSDDVMTVSASAGGTRIAYEADIRLKGLFRIAEPFLGVPMKKMGDAALDGLSARLSR